MTAETCIETLNALSKVQADLVKKYELENPGFTLVRVVETDCSIVWEEANKYREQISRVYQDPAVFRHPAGGPHGIVPINRVGSDPSVIVIPAESTEASASCDGGMMRRKEKETPWSSESAMFNEFMRIAKKLGFICYPETCGHDLVMVAGPELKSELSQVRGLEPGDVIVVEGKLRASIEVLRQALPPGLRASESDSCADFYCVLVPTCDSDFSEVAGACGIVVLALPPAESRERARLKEDEWLIMPLRFAQALA